MAKVKTAKSIEVKPVEKKSIEAKLPVEKKQVTTEPTKVNPVDPIETMGVDTEKVVEKQKKEKETEVLNNVHPKTDESKLNILHKGQIATLHDGKGGWTQKVVS